jgi:alanyl-tRNA synthetase
VRRTGEVGLIKLLDFVRYKGGVRIHMQCGRAALLDYRARYEQAAKCSALMSVKQGEIADGVSALLKANEELAFLLKGFKRQAASMVARTILTSLPVSLFIESDMDAEFWREVASLISAEKNGVFAFFYKKDEALYAYTVCSKDNDLKPLCTAINQALSGRGGGKNGMVQGSVSASEEEIRAFFGSYII